MKTLYTLIIALFLSIAINAQTNEWISATAGNWDVASNWSLGVIPTASHDVAIPSGLGIVTIPSGYTAEAKIVFVPGHLIIDQNATLTVGGSTNHGIFNTGIVINHGTINISNTPSSGILNFQIDADFTNYGIIKCLAGIGDDGIHNTEAAVFTNESGGSIEISNTADNGIYNAGANTTFTNKGSIKCLAGIGDDGIENSADFTNVSGASIEISNTTNTGILNHNNFTNKGIIKIHTGIDGFGIQNLNGGASFINDVGGNIEISNTLVTGIFNAGGSPGFYATFTNKGIIKCLDEIGHDGIENSADFINDFGASIEISNTTNNGILNNDNFINKGTIKCLDGIGENGIKNWKGVASFLNDAGGNIEISNTIGDGIHSRANIFFPMTTFTNKGTIKCLTGIGGDGINNWDKASFTNDAGANIEVSNTISDGIDNGFGFTHFTNKGTIKCLIGIGGDGINNQAVASFVNDVGAITEISNTTGHGIKNADIGTTFQNSGTIQCLAGIGLSGIMGELGASFTNNSTGNIEILHADQHGINISSSSSFTNKPAGYLEIHNTGGYGIYRSAGDFLNEACGIIEITEQIYDLSTVGDMTNSGYMFQDYNGTNITSIINNGVIEDIQGSFPTSGITNWGYIVAPLSGTFIENQIVNDALLGIGNGYTVIQDKFYTDVNLMTSAGPYDYFNNTWTPNFDAVGLTKFYIQFHNGTCAVVMEINLDSPVQCGESIATWDGSISNLWDDPDNWTPTGVPNKCSSVEIGAGQDILIQAGTIAEALALKNSGTLTIEGSLQLFDAKDKPALRNINGLITNNGVILIQNVTGTNPLSRGIINRTEGGTATIINNGTIEIDQISKEGIYNTSSAVFVQNGVCRITNVGTIPFNNAANATVKGSSPIELIGGGTFFNLAKVNPGNSPGQLTIDGLYDCDVAANSIIEIAGIDGVGSPDGHDQLVVNEAELNGTLDVSLINGFVPDFGESFIIMTSPSGNINGTFSTVIHSPPTYWEVDYFPGYVEITAVATLPIELLSFNVRTLYDKVQINWSTASERDNDYFTIERSWDGKEWSALKVVESNGNSQQLTHYEAMDNQPYSGISYYRLKQTDIDGTSTYSSIKSINFSSDDVDLRAYPNPTLDEIIIEGKDIHNCKIYTLTGQELTHLTPYIHQGETRATIDLSRVLPGMYIIKTESKMIRVQKL